MTDNYCRCGLRLSVADTSGLCLSCVADDRRMAAEAPAKWLVLDAAGKKQCRCGRGPVARWSTYECAECAATRVRANRAKRTGVSA
jgi:hypothetical protein